MPAVNLEFVLYLNPLHRQQSVYEQARLSFLNPYQLLNRYSRSITCLTPPFFQSNLLKMSPLSRTKAKLLPASETKFPSDGSNLMELPTELHLMISSYLTYPDALSLKHTNRHFYSMVYTGVNLKIEWLIERRTLHLDCPHDQKCELGSDMRFCRGSVRYVLPSLSMA